MSDTTFLIDLISNFGFPVVIVFYLLNRFERRLDTIIDLLQSLTKSLT
ncbi:YvrJ family protein [Atopobacter phocae]|nr:YvrJ family protein [Atopobacter phocae]